MTEDDEFVCGESVDHDLHLISERDGMKAYECRNCGGEVVEEDEPERCECGHGPDSHEAAGFRQNSRTGKTHWKRYCRGHKGYDTLTGEKPCRCRGYVQVADQR